MSDEEIASVLDSWEFWARPDQRTPAGDWRVWLFLGGRGAGKTRAGAEWIAAGIGSGEMRRIALVGATFHDARAVMIEGASGLLSVDKAAVYEPSNMRVLWPSGAVAMVLSAEEPDGFRGHQFDAAWGDEFCKWQDPQGALDMLQMGLRMGKDPRLLLTTTPRNIKALDTIMNTPGNEMTQARTRDNGANLAPGFLAQMEARYGGTRLGRQELEAEIIADNEQALWRREWIETTRVRAAPDLTRIVVAVDPPVSLTGDECGIVVAGMAEGQFYVIADRSQGGLTPAGWASRVVDTYEGFNCDCIVAEGNQGGEMVRQVIADQLPNAPVRMKHAKDGKKVRAEPISLLYEQSKVHHVGTFPELEDQLCNFDGSGKSPDRLDALVWALHSLSRPLRAEPRIRLL